jgi:hypothetical protein
VRSGAHSEGGSYYTEDYSDYSESDVSAAALPPPPAPPARRRGPFACFKPKPKPEPVAPPAAEEAPAEGARAAARRTAAAGANTLFVVGRALRNHPRDTAFSRRALLRLTRPPPWCDVARR